ncbi:hypothetical protein OR16_26768 [Cupriavidus basilensis OR16]|uniref:Uncharacterized protein n=1 Tax=Cupriavidus basilensis OR16 TaxID=1127483 RepID=H1SB25_9BURK|nr:hypothetical protein OR16_26768 [Cupriavidus basilensis OR16]
MRDPQRREAIGGAVQANAEQAVDQRAGIRRKWRQGAMAGGLRHGMQCHAGRARLQPGTPGVGGQAIGFGRQPHLDLAPGLVQAGGGYQRVAAVIARAGQQQQRARWRVVRQPGRRRGAGPGHQFEGGQAGHGGRFDAADGRHVVQRDSAGARRVQRQPGMVWQHSGQRGRSRGKALHG